MSSPQSPANGTAISPLPVKPDVDDLFATLFAPATPPASPLPLGSPSIFSPPPSARSHVTSISPASSTESDFGAFVSVPPSDDPLAQLSSTTEPSSTSAVPPPRRLSATITDFFTEAKAATARNQQGFLVELLEHEDDPMYWHKRGASPLGSVVPSGATTPQPPPPAVDIDNSEILGALAKPVKAVVESSVVGHLLDSLTEATSDNAFSPPPPPPPVEFVNVTTRRSASSSPPLLRSPSLPPSPSRPTPPVLTRTDSMTSIFSSSPQPSRWVSNFLTYRGPPPLPPLSVSPAPTVPQVRVGPKRADITHGSPFAPVPFVPASGAPGFDGDRSWNKGFDAKGKSADAVERRGVQLLGRKESTRAVLGTALANTLRSYLPARARLPRTWTLLFSLDQHGISLQTLYARCGAHTGGALLVVRDAEDGCFGAWVADGIREGRGSYIGSGESFLWKAHGEDVRVFKWTGKNDYVALCEPGSISFGGGDGHYGLYLDETLYEGSSARCPTFNNDPLCTSSGASPDDGGGTATFECVGLEVWGVAS
ncbi:TLD-domain-containing protein [Lactarius hengduanensis]|nr:TLD-domain-containing protein [Lactarius hengduanensis]